MAERTSVTQRVQIGVESTPGTAVAANKELPSISIEPGIKANIDAFRTAGNKFPTIHSLGKEWSEALVKGKPTFDEMVYLLATLLTAPTFAQVGATTAYTATYAPSSTAEDSPKTLTVEQGSSVRAHKSAYNLMTELGLSLDRDKCDLSGKMMGRAITDGITLTASPTSVDQIPILPLDFEVWADDASAGLGTTKLSRLLKLDLKVANRFAPLWVIDRSQASYVTHVETPNDVQLDLLMEADSNAMALLTTMRNGAFKFLRVKATSAQNAGTSTPYSLTLNLAGQIAAPKMFEDSDGVYAIGWTFDITHNGGWGKALDAAIVSKTQSI